MGCTTAKPVAVPIQTSAPPSVDPIAAIPSQPVQPAGPPSEHTSHSGSNSNQDNRSATSGQSWVTDDMSFKAHLSRVSGFAELKSKYEIGKLLGQGITGQVWLCTSKINSQVYALKSLNVTRMDERQTAELRAEIEMLKQLDHPNVVSLVEIFTSQTNISLVMEYCSGGDLSDRRFKTEKDLASVIHQILCAVAHCHQMGIIHRDLKLENVMFSTLESDKLRLIDFGLSRTFYAQQQLASQNTQDAHIDELNDHDRAMKTVCGTICYMAPEVLRRRYGMKADIWAIGVIAFTLMTGDPPFNDDDPGEVLRKVKRGVVHYDSRHWKRLSSTAQDFVRALLTFNVDDRPSARQALMLPWMTQYRSWYWKEHCPINRVVARSAWQALLQFAGYPLIKKAAYMIVAHTAKPSEKSDLNELFLFLDKDFTGELKSEHLRILMTEFGDPDSALTNEQFLALFNVLDQDKTGVIHYMEFLSATIECKVKVTDSLINQAFEHLDADSSGFITAENIADLLGKRYTLEEAKDLVAQGFRSLGLEPGTKISRDLFCQMMEQVGLPSPFPTKVSPERLKVDPTVNDGPSFLENSISKTNAANGLEEFGSTFKQKVSTVVTTEDDVAIALQPSRSNGSQNGEPPSKQNGSAMPTSGGNPFQGSSLDGVRGSGAFVPDDDVEETKMGSG